MKEQQIRQLVREELKNLNENTLPETIARGLNFDYTVVSDDPTRSVIDTGRYTITLTYGQASTRVKVEPSGETFSAGYDNDEKIVRRLNQIVS